VTVAIMNYLQSMLVVHIALFALMIYISNMNVNLEFIAYTAA